MTFPKAQPSVPRPAPKTYASQRERWFDAQYIAECAVADTLNTEYIGDALPLAWPNLGPEVFSAYFGAPLEYGETTAWSTPCLQNMCEADRLQFSTDNPYWKKTLEMTDILLQAGKGKFYVGVTDLHGGGDAIAAFRDPAQLCMDLVESPEAVKSLLRRVDAAYYACQTLFFDKLQAARQAITTWAGIVSTRRWYVPSNDFSCMISKAMFDECFLPGIAEECRRLETSIYHLDGPQALRHLDSLLEIKELNAIQWVYGAGGGRPPDWTHVYTRCQQAGKGLQIFIDAEEVDWLVETLRPEGLWIHVSGVRDKSQADALLKRISRWR